MSNKKTISSIPGNNYKKTIQNLKSKEKRRSRMVYSFTDLVEKLFEKEQNLIPTK